VGLGWDLTGIGSISRPLGKSGPYNLSFGGGAFEIKQSGGVLTTDPQGFLKIEHSEGLAWNTQPWTVRTSDGMKYTFGNPAGAVGGGTAYEAFWTGWGQDCRVRATQWGLTRIEDAAGNRWDITWAHETKDVSNGCPGNAGQYTRASYPETLTLTPKNGAATVRVRLVREPRNDKNVCKYSDFSQINSFGDGRLKQVFVEAYTAAGAWQVVRRYDLGYTYDSTTLGCGTDPGSGNHSLLTSITQYDSNGASALPAYTFGYQGGGNSVRLRTADNGYGGAVQFNYSPEFVGNNAGCTSYQWQVVTSQVITNGAAPGLGLFSTTEYAPTGAYAYVMPVGCNNGAEIPRDTYEFLGHTAVQEVVKDAAGQAVTQRNHSYSYQYVGTGWQDIRPDPRKGKETLVVTMQPGGSELGRTATGWLLQTVAGVDWPYTSAVTQTQGSAVAVTRYAYAIANQGGSTQYGNVTHIREYANATDATPYRTTERWYYPRDDASAYIVNRVAQEKLWAGDSGGACQRQTRQIYDTTGFNQQQTPPTKGWLKEVWQAKTCDSANQSDWVRPALYSYDLYGNRTSEGNAAGATTTTTYDATFKTYPVTQITTPGAGGGVTLTTTLKYYGVSGAEANGSGLAGQLQSSTDPNSAATRLTYDGFGRVTEIHKPGVGWANPATEKYAYTDSPAPLAVRHSLRDDQNGDASGTATYLDDWAFYDGLGQVVQTQGEAASSSQSILVNTQYQPLGVLRASVPYTVTGGLAGY
jgi:YD repeat-containing protein